MGAKTSKSRKSLGVQATVTAKTYQKKIMKVRKDSIRNRYVILKKIADSYSGALYNVLHLNSNAGRVIKFVPVNSLKSGDAQNLLYKLRIIHSLDHANIIKVYEAYQDERNLAIITDCCYGGELLDRIVSQKFISENQAAKYLLQIVSATIHLQSNGVVQRFLKPENLLFETPKENSNLKMIDFCIWSQYPISKRILERLGSPYFMAPELFSGNYNDKCDVWSMGVLLHLMLSGIPPFNGKNDTEILQSIMTNELLFEGKIWKKVSPGAKELIRSMLTREVIARPSAMMVFENQWLQTCGNNLESDKTITKLSVKKLSIFNTTSKLQRAIQTFITTQAMISEEMAVLSETVSSRDKNGSGLLIWKDLYEAIAGLSGDASISVIKFLAKDDRDRNGWINYTECLTDATKSMKELSRNRLNAAFREFDKDGSGKISVSELIKAIGGEKNQSNMLVEILKESIADDDDEEIDLEELCNFVKNNKESSRV